MFLLIRTVDTADRFIQSVFTFHNVSINTTLLHMPFLLLYNFTFHNVSINTTQVLPGLLSFLYTFTFHNVSINTADELGVNKQKVYRFTFHNVSINTRAPHPHIIQDLFYHFLSTLSFTIFLKQNLHSQ